MQAFSSDQISLEYNFPMQTGRPSKNPRTPFGEKLHAAREASGLSQAFVSKKMGVSQNAYAMWERHPVALRPQQIQQLAQLLNVSPDYFFDQTKLIRSGPAGRLRQVFERASRLPRNQQSKVAEFVEAFVNQHAKAA